MSEDTSDQDMKYQEQKQDYHVRNFPSAVLKQILDKIDSDSSVSPTMCRDMFSSCERYAGCDIDSKIKQHLTNISVSLEKSEIMHEVKSMMMYLSDDDTLANEIKTKGDITDALNKMKRIIQEFKSAKKVNEEYLNPLKLDRPNTMFLVPLHIVLSNISTETAYRALNDCWEMGCFDKFIEIMLKIDLKLSLFSNTIDGILEIVNSDSFVLNG